MQHRKNEWRIVFCARYCTHLISEIRDLPDAIAITYGDSILAESRADALFVRKVGGNREGDVEVENPEKESSVDNDEKNSELSDLNLETGSIREEE